MCVIRLVLCLLIIQSAVVSSAAPQRATFDVVVFGANPCGIAAAVAAARNGHSVALVAQGKHIGGLMSSGLSITDVRFLNAFGGLFKEFIERSAAFYKARYGNESQQLQDSNNGLWFEPHVAETLFEEMIARETRLKLFRDYRLVRALKSGNKVDGLVIAARAEQQELALHAAVTIDASYEGDAAAAAGAVFLVGREARDETWEPYAGKVFLKNPGMQILPGSTGEGDARVQAYNYRLCLTPQPDLRVPIQQPATYQREEFAPLVEAVQRGTIKSFQDVVRVAPMANGKYSANNSPIVRSLDLPADNYDYPNADEQRRAQIIARYRDYTLGLLWFLQHDDALPAAFRNDARNWGLCKDEFADNGHMPYELYVREARRIVGHKTFSASDAFLAPGSERTPLHADAIAVADYHVDSHLVQRQQAGFPQIEGHVYLRPLSKPAQVPYGVIVPREVEGLLVPGALSATHLGFGALRLEPVWMALGQAAGTAAALALETKSLPSTLSITQLQRRLLQAGQVITFFHDQPGPDAVWLQLNRPQERSRQLVLSEIPQPRYSPGLQFFGARGFFTSYYARPFDPVTRSEAVRWLTRFAELEGLKLNAVARATLPDVTATHPDYQMIAALLNARIVETWAGSTGFFPHAPVARADAVRWLVRLKQQSRNWTLNKTNAAAVWNDLTADQSDFAFFQTLHARNALPPGWGERAQPGFYITREEFCDLLLAVFEESRN
ncbi:MAG: FAD-dependent oxidoreductase [Blastocatellia bacterium]